MSTGGAHFYRPPDRGRTRLAIRAAVASTAVALILVGLKSYAAVETGSVTMLGSLADTGIDLVASVATLYGVRFAAQPADRDHRFGHGKAEALAALFQVVVIVLSAIFILVRAISRLAAGEMTTNAETGIGVSITAIALTLALMIYQRHVIAETGSVAIHADHVHYQSDLLLNLAVITALVFEQYLHIRNADSACGIVIALWLGWGAWRASSRSIDQLMDREWPEEKRERFLAVAARHPALDGIHDLRTRSSGTRDFVQFHVWVDPAMTILEAHTVMDEVEDQLVAQFPGTEVLIHLDPEGHVDREGELPSALTEEATR